MPAAAVIPAPIAYIKVVAVKKLVVGLVCAVRGWPAPKRAFRFGPGGALKSAAGGTLALTGRRPHAGCSVTVRKVEFQGRHWVQLNTLAWNNKIWLLPYFVGFDWWE